MHGILTLYESIQTGELTRRREQTGAGAGITVEQHDGQAEPVAVGTQRPERGHVTLLENS